MFWIGGHIKADSVSAANLKTGESKTALPPMLSAGNTTAQQTIFLVRLDISSVAVSLGLGTSIILMMLCVSFLGLPSGSTTSSDGVGLLHICWLCRDLPHLLEGVKQPTEAALRAGGLVDIQLSNMSSAEHKSSTTNSTIQLGNINGDHSPPTPPRHHSVHLSLLGILLSQKEHNITFSLDDQNTVSFWIKFIATVFGTAGIGSSVASLYKQLSLPASILATTSIFAYLRAISMLHITTPALFSVETFLFPSPSTATIQSIPQWNETRNEAITAYLDNMAAFLPWMQNLDESQTPSLIDQTLYDTLAEISRDIGMVNISATGFNITCGYLEATSIEIQYDGNFYNISFAPNSESVSVFAGGTNILTLSAMNRLDTTFEEPEVSNSIVFFLWGDRISSGRHRHRDQFQHEFPVLQCSRSLVSQEGQVDAVSRTIIPSSLTPTLHKNHSKWHPYRPAVNDTTTSLLHASLWAKILGELPFSGIELEGAIDLSWGMYYSALTFDGDIPQNQQYAIHRGDPKADGVPETT
ncbi:hypothetical protein B0H13DRAFT_1863927 [Mycena leptocephala]|nr:hypothetical protein B0H13DRAFT_1863927 [Mycena leptocephala]